MKTFLWEGINTHHQTMNGMLDAQNKKLAALILQTQQIKVQKIIQQSRWTIENYRQKISPADITSFLQQLHTLLTSGINLVSALDTIEKSEETPPIKRLLQKIKQSLQNGNALAQTLTKYPKHFSALTCHLIHIAEQSGTLEETLAHIIQHQKMIKRLKDSAKKALIYPAIVITVATLVTIILLLVVVPRFNALYANFNATLPLLTQLIIKLAASIQRFGGVLLLFLALVLTTTLSILKKVPALKQKSDRYFLSLPLIGPLTQKIILARITHTLSMILSTGIPLLEATSLIKHLTNNLAIQHCFAAIQSNIRQGTPLHQAMQRHEKLLPPLLIQMVAIGEEAGKLDNMLQRIAAIFEEEIDDKIQNLGQLIEPLIMIIVGIIVGILVIAMYLPIFKLGTVI